MALAFASSNEVTHFCLSTSLFALRWKVWVPPPLLTIKQLLLLLPCSVWMIAPCKLIVPRHVWAISAWFLKDIKLRLGTMMFRWTIKFRSPPPSRIDSSYWNQMLDLWSLQISKLICNDHRSDALTYIRHLVSIGRIYPWGGGLRNLIVQRNIIVLQFELAWELFEWMK